MTPHPLYLAIDTVLGGTSVALGRAGEAIAVETGAGESEQAERLVPMISALMKDGNIQPAQLDGLLVDTGPGGFTGVRVGISAARALAFAWKQPLAGISSFELLCVAATRALPGRDEPLAVIRASGRGEVNIQRFARGEPFASISQPIERHSIGEAATRYRFELDTLLSAPGAACVVWPEGGEIWQPPKGFSGADALIAAVEILPESRWREAAAPVYARPPDARPREASSS